MKHHNITDETLQIHYCNIGGYKNLTELNENFGSVNLVKKIKKIRQNIEKMLLKYHDLTVKTI